MGLVFLDVGKQNDKYSCTNRQLCYRLINNYINGDQTLI
jgi:hypothetical protein